MKTSSKQKILTLLKQGKTYAQISIKLHCAKSTIAYHSKCSGIKSKHLPKILTEPEIQAIEIFYKTHSIRETSKQFKISKTTILRHCNVKRVLLSDEERRANNYFRVKHSRKIMKERSVEHKGGKCEICNYSKCIQALEFHHKNPNKKEFSLSQTRMYSSWNKIKKELNKCILVCANCHREIHSKL